MPVRWKQPQPGEIVRVRSCEIYFELPRGLPEHTDAIFIRQEPGRYIVQALDQEWNIPMQCLVHKEERQLNGVWLDSWDRRVRKTQAMLDRLAQTKSPT